MGMRTWLTNLTEAGQVRLLNVQLDTLFKKTVHSDFLSSHPVGSLYWTSSSENPGTEFGGEWYSLGLEVREGITFNVWTRVL